MKILKSLFLICFFIAVVWASWNVPIVTETTSQQLNSVRSLIDDNYQLSQKVKEFADRKNGFNMALAAFEEENVSEKVKF